MVHPREQEKSMIDLIPENINLHPKNFTDLLSVVYLKGKVYMGLAPKELFFYPENAIHSVDKQSSVSRAHFKLKEALERSHLAIPAAGVAVDVGAAPGGIAMYLADRMSKVYAIDPAELNVERPNLVHLKMRAEDAVPSISEEIDILNCDMNKKIETAIDVLKLFDHKLHEGSLICLTIKMSERRGMAKKVDAAVQYFKQKFPNFEILRIMYLLANSNMERFLVARKAIAPSIGY